MKHLAGYFVLTGIALIVAGIAGAPVLYLGIALTVFGALIDRTKQKPR